jgi:SAM-dependent methyltransferase
MCPTSITGTAMTEPVTPTRAHWEHIYQSKDWADLSWHERTPGRSLELIMKHLTSTAGRIIDIGGGDSQLVDELLDRGHSDVTVLDLSSEALAHSQQRLGARASAVIWLQGDVTQVPLPPGHYDLWHDRAAFPFLTSEADRVRYIGAAARALKRGGMAVIGTFALDGPTRCSGLDVVQYSPESLAAAFGPDFHLEDGLSDIHVTPSGVEQRFSYAVLQLNSTRPRIAPHAPTRSPPSR